MKQLLDQRVLVLGLGESGIAMARWAGRCGAASIVVADSREQPPKLDALRAELPQVEFVVGFDPALLGPEDSRTIDRVLKSPGLSPLDAALVPLLAAADERVIPVHGELDLFAQALHQLHAERGYAPKVIAITGTNGKTTTTMLCGMLVERSGARVAVAGNVGPTMLDTLAAALDAEPASQTVPANALEAATDVASDAASAPAEGGEGGGPPAHLIPPPPRGPVFEHLPEVWVLELSSFQLDGVRLGAGGFAPSAATVLNVSQDHLDWHGSLAAYTAAKQRVFGAAEAWASVMVVNRDEPAVEAMVPASVLIKAAQRGARHRTLERKVVRFGLDAPRRPGDFGLVVENGMSWLVRALEADETVKRAKRGTVDEVEEIHLQRLMPADALRIRGRHNASNALAALALASAAGVPLAPMLHGLRDYRGEPHRVQVLGSVGGVEAVDDSKGTNVGATVAAINGLGADKAPARLVVILGGDGKGQDFAPLAAPVARHARAVALIGRDADAIAAALAATPVPQQRFDALDVATRWCFAQAEPGDAVLLSPACASLDMFRNYAHRAEVFAATVSELALERGEELAA